MTIHPQLRDKLKDMYPEQIQIIEQELKHTAAQEANSNGDNTQIEFKQLLKTLYISQDPDAVIIRQIPESEQYYYGTASLTQSVLSCVFFEFQEEKLVKLLLECGAKVDQNLYHSVVRCLNLDLLHYAEQKDISLYQFMLTYSQNDPYRDIKLSILDNDIPRLKDTLVKTYSTYATFLKAQKTNKKTEDKASVKANQKIKSQHSDTDIDFDSGSDSEPESEHVSGYSTDKDISPNEDLYSYSFYNLKKAIHAFTFETYVKLGNPTYEMLECLAQQSLFDLRELTEGSDYEKDSEEDSYQASDDSEANENAIEPVKWIDAPINGEKKIQFATGVLMTGIMYKKAVLIKAAFDHGAKNQIQDEIPLLSFALGKKSTTIETIKQFIEHGADVNQDLSKLNKGVESRSGLDNHNIHIAATRLNSQSFRYLLNETDINVHALTPNGLNALHLAVMTSISTEVDRCETDFKDIFEDDIKDRRVHIIKMLVEKGLDINSVCASGKNAMDYTCDLELRAYVAVIQTLLEQGIRVKGAEPFTYDVAAVSVLYEHLETLNCLKYHGMDINAKLKHNGLTPLEFALISDKYHIARGLLYDSIDLTVQNIRPGTPLLHIAVEKGDSKFLESLLMHRKLDKFALDQNGRNALEVALEKGNLKIIRILKAAGLSCSAFIASIEQQYPQYTNSLELDEKESAEGLVIKTILKDKAINVFSPFDFLATKKIKMCFEASEYHNGLVPLLDIAVANNLPDLVRFLLENGAVVDWLAITGKKPYHPFCKNSYFEIALNLESYSIYCLLLEYCNPSFRGEDDILRAIIENDVEGCRQAYYEYQKKYQQGWDRYSERSDLLKVVEPFVFKLYFTRNSHASYSVLNYLLSENLLTIEEKFYLSPKASQAAPQNLNLELMRATQILYLGIQYNQSSLVEKALKHHADPNFMMKNGYAITYAVERYHTHEGIIKALIRAGADLTVSSSHVENGTHDYKLVHLATRKLNVKSFKVLIDSGKIDLFTVVPHKSSNLHQGENAIHILARSMTRLGLLSDYREPLADKKEKLQILVQNGLDVNSLNIKGDSWENCLGYFFSPSDYRLKEEIFLSCGAEKGIGKRPAVGMFSLQYRGYQDQTQTQSQPEPVIFRQAPVQEVCEKTDQTLVLVDDLSPSDEDVNSSKRAVSPTSRL